MEPPPVEPPEGAPLARVLVVDDEPMLRRLAGRALREAGYAVTEAPDGLAGWELARTATEPFDLVVTDSRMPNMAGPELVRRLLDFNPSLPIVQLSGSRSKRDPATLDLPPNVRTLFKPFDLQDLVRTVSELLAGPAD